MPQHVLSERCGGEGRTVAHGERELRQAGGGFSPALKRVRLSERTALTAGGKARAVGEQHSRPSVQW